MVTSRHYRCQRACANNLQWVRHLAGPPHRTYPAKPGQAFEQQFKMFEPSWWSKTTSGNATSMIGDPWFPGTWREAMQMSLRGLPECSRCRRVGLGNLTPSPSQNSGLEPLDSSGSCHPVRAAALRQNRRAPPVSSWPIMVPTWIACLLRSTDITPLQRYYQAVRPSASHPYSRPRGSVHLWLLRLYRCQGSHVPYARLF